MAEWWKTPYHGGPMLDAPPFPRPLHPPGSPGYPPSSDGPDVLAYKRGISRLGRWPWTPKEWDDSYSKNFAHGKEGGNVGDSGVAGCQRQQHWEDSGYIGERFYNFLRSALVPESLPNGGEYALDATAINLLEEAWEIFEGVDAPSAAKGSSAQARLSKAVSQLGISESPAGSNNQKYGAWYGMNGEPWCAIFVTWSDQLSGKPSDSFKCGSRYAYVPYMLSDARSNAYGLSVTGDPKPGDIVVYDWQGDGVVDHVGIFEKWSGGMFYAIEGNTSAQDNSNGGQVQRRYRERHGATFIRVREP